MSRGTESGQRPLLDSRGQSLVEVLVVLSVATIVMVALIIIIIVGLRNAQFAQNQAKSTKYAQEAIEQVKSIRDRNGTIRFAEKTNFAELWDVYMNGDSSCADSLGEAVGCYFILESGPSLVSTTFGTSKDLGDGFSRQIIFEDKNNLTPPHYQTEKWVNVKVFWTDSSGMHESNLQTIVTNYNQI